MFFRTFKSFPMVLLAVSLAALAFVASGNQVRQTLKTRPKAVKITSTILKVNRNGGCNSDLQDWVSAVEVNNPATVLSIRCTTEETTAVAARWTLTDKRYVLGGSLTGIAGGDLPFAPRKDKPGCFDVNLKNHLPAVPPKAPYTMTYYVYVTLFDQQQNELSISSPVIARYVAPGPPTVFPDDMGQEGDTQAQALLQEAYKQLKAKFGLADPLGPVKTGKNLPATQVFSTETGEKASIEIVGSPSSPSIFVCVPRKLVPSYSVYANQWFEYVFYQGRVAVPPVAEKDQYPPPDDLPPALTDTGAWAAYDQYDLGEGTNCTNNPPHWTPILTDYDPSWIGRIHRFMQTKGTWQSALNEINAARDRAKSQDLRDRALEPWESVKLCGMIEDAGYPSGDLAADHATWYRDGDNVPFAADFWVLSEVSDEENAAQDWDIRVNPDPAYAYLAYRYGYMLENQPVRFLHVEIEQFGLVPPSLWPGYRLHYKDTYWPQKGEWAQTVGRWVTDNGHPEEVPAGSDTGTCICEDGLYDCDLKDGFFTEIHPPELLVSTRTIDDYSSEARVIVTGAWTGSNMSFVVNPPPRPSAEATLRWKTVKSDRVTEGYDRKDGVELEFIPKGQPGNPNHLECIVRNTAPGGTARVCNGSVGLYRDRGLHAIIQCEWVEPAATLKGSVRAGQAPAAGAYVFWRNADIENSTWRYVRVNEQGHYTIGHLTVGSTIWVRPAGSGYDFLRVPQKVVLDRNQREKVMDFTAIRAQSPGKTFDRLPRSRAVRSPVALKPTPVSGQANSPEEEALRLIQSMLLKIGEPTGDLGVWRNELGYSDDGMIMVGLSGLADANSQPVPDLQSAFAVGATPSGSNILIEGTPTSGIAGAGIRVSLLLGNPAVGTRVIQSVETQTNAKGIASVRFQAGSHVEDAVFRVEVTSNPFNPWFLPTAEGQAHLFFPAKTGTDLDPGTGASPKAYRLEVFSPSALNFDALEREFGKSGSYAREFLWKIRERQTTKSLRPAAKGIGVPMKSAKLKRVVSGDRKRLKK